MKIFYINDLHLDNRLNRKDPDIEHIIQNFINNLLVDENNCLIDDKILKESLLIIAGDLSNYNELSKIFLEKISNIFDQIVFVGGNHDLYLLDNKCKYKYQNDSLIKERDLYNFTKRINNIHFLGEDYDGILNYKGLKIGGERMISNPYENIKYLSFYQNYMADFKYISFASTKELTSLHQKNINYYNSLKNENLDIFVSHYPIITTNSHTILGRDQDGSIGSFKTFVDELIAPINFFGHVHERQKYKIVDHLFLTNAGGYPGEYSFVALKSIEL